MFDSEEREQNTHKIAPALFDFFIYFHSRVVKRHTQLIRSRIWDTHINTIILY